jgi:protein-S-isoprenylcysteine O-methyltransferase Ste14
MSQTRWWKGAHGEWYVVIQFALFVLVVFGPRTWPGWPAWALPDAQLLSAVGGILILLGGLLAVAGVLQLGSNITAVPYPKDQARLVETGPYRLVRHPIYSGAIFMALGWACWVHGWLTLGYAILLFVFFEVKARREEEWLRQKFAGYADYQKRARKLIPFVH